MPDDALAAIVGHSHAAWLRAGAAADAAFTLTSTPGEAVALAALAAAESWDRALYMAFSISLWKPRAVSMAAARA